MTETLVGRELEIASDPGAFQPQVTMDTAEPRSTVVHSAMENLPEHIIQKLDALIQVPANWDSYDGDPVNPDVVASARGLLALLFSNYALPTPQLSPTRSGGVLIEWVSDPHELEVELVSPDAFSFVYSNVQSAFEYEGEAFRDELLDDRFLRYLNYIS